MGQHKSTAQGAADGDRQEGEEGADMERFLRLAGIAGDVRKCTTGGELASSFVFFCEYVFSCHLANKVEQTNISPQKDSSFESKSRRTKQQQNVQARNIKGFEKGSSRK